MRERGLWMRGVMGGGEGEMDEGCVRVVRRKEVWMMGREGG